MKINLSLFLVIVATTFFFSCSDSKTASSENESTSTEISSEETASKPRPKQNMSPSQRLSTQFEELGLGLSAEQVSQIDAIAANYDFNNAADRDARKAMRQTFQNEVFENVLTAEQQSAYNQSKAAR